MKFVNGSTGGTDNLSKKRQTLRDKIFLITHKSYQRLHRPLITSVSYESLRKLLKKIPLETLKKLKNCPKLSSTLKIVRGILACQKGVNVYE